MKYNVFLSRFFITDYLKNTRLPAVKRCFNVSKILIIASQSHNIRRLVLKLVIRVREYIMFFQKRKICRNLSRARNVVFDLCVLCVYRDSGALLHLIKSSLGSGILAMPNAFKNGGLIFGLIGTAAIGALCTHCIYLLVSTKTI